MKKALSLLLALVLMASVFAGCNDQTSANLGEFVDVDYKFNEEADKVTDSSDMPDWTGNQLDLTVWYASGSYHATKNKISDSDVVWPELKRVTGVTFNSEKSFDNNGETQDAKISKIIATEEWPDILWGSSNSITDQLIEQDMLWELSELIPEYMPHLHALMQKGDFMKSTREDGKIYELYMDCKMTYAFPDMDPEILARNTNPVHNTSYVYVRDDILKELKPEALTQKELLSIFEKNGTFTQDEILNGAFNSKEEFYQFLRDVKALGKKSGNRDVYGTYALTGSDNWDFLSVLAGGLNGFNSWQGVSNNNYFTYYDVETEKIEYMFQQDWYKQDVKELVELIQEDVICQDSLIDNRAAFEEKCATGQYAVLYGGTMPDINTLNKNAEPYGYQYRKVIINIPYNEAKFLPIANTIGGSYKYAFFKNSISAEELPQVLRFFDYQLTQAGGKLRYWGPRSAGLFTEEEDGTLRFVDKQLEDEAVRDTGSDLLVKYGLSGKAWIQAPPGTSEWNPKYVYDVLPSIKTMERYYTTGLYNPQKQIHGTAPTVYTKFPEYIEETKTFWDARTSFENALTKVLTATNDEEFEKLWVDLLALAERNGLTSEVLEEINDVWVNNINKDYMQNVYDHIAKVKK